MTKKNSNDIVFPMAVITEQGQRANIENASQEFQTRLLNILGNPEQADVIWTRNRIDPEGHLEVSELAHLEISNHEITSDSFGDLSLGNGNELPTKSIQDLIALPFKILHVPRANSLRIRTGSSFEPKATINATLKEPTTELAANMGVGEGPAANIDRLIIHAQVFADGSDILNLSGAIKPENSRSLPESVEVIKQILPGAFASEATESTTSDQ